MVCKGGNLKSVGNENFRRFTSKWTRVRSAGKSLSQSRGKLPLLFEATVVMTLIIWIRVQLHIRFYELTSTWKWTLVKKHIKWTRVRSAGKSLSQSRGKLPLLFEATVVMTLIIWIRVQLHIWFYELLAVMYNNSTWTQSLADSQWLRLEDCTACFWKTLSWFIMPLNQSHIEEDKCNCLLL